MYRRKLFAILLLIIALAIISNGCGSDASDFKIEDVSRYIQSGVNADTDTHDGFFFELLHYYKQHLYMTNGHTLSKWAYENEEYSCKQTIPTSKLFPQAYENIDKTIDYIKNGEANTVSCDGRFICIFNAGDPGTFYLWDTEIETLYKIKPLSPIRKIQWADNEPLLYMLTEENRLYCLDPVSRNVTATSIKTIIPDVSEKNIHILKEGIIYYDGLQVQFADGESEDQVIIDNVIEFFGVYKNTLVIKRMDNKVEAGFIEDKWHPFYSQRINDCYPVNGQFLRFHKTGNGDEVELLDLLTGSISSFKTFGYGYEVFPKTNAIMLFDSNGTPYVQKPDAAAIPLQLGHEKPYVNKTTVIPILSHEADGECNLKLFSMEDHEWLLFKIDTEAKT